MHLNAFWPSTDAVTDADACLLNSCFKIKPQRYVSSKQFYLFYVISSVWMNWNWGTFDDYSSWNERANGKINGMNVILKWKIWVIDSDKLNKLCEWPSNDICYQNKEFGF